MSARLACTLGTVVRRPSLPVGLALGALFVFGLVASASAHDDKVPLGGDALQILTSLGPQEASFSFARSGDPGIRIEHAPTEGAGFALVVVGAGPSAGRTPVVELANEHWSDDGSEGFIYSDPAGESGGITSVVFQEGHIAIEGGGASWPWSPNGPQDAVAVHLRLDDLWFCAEFAVGDASITANEAGHFEASAASTPVACAESVCGNGELEAGEECDHGSLEPGDGCDDDCSVGECFGEEFENTFDAIQTVIFDGYGCSSPSCHGGVSSSGGLDLREGFAYESLMGPDGGGAPSKGSLRPRVHPSEPERSYLWLKVAAKTSPELVMEEVGTPMPPLNRTVTEEHLAALRLWLRGGAPEDRVVEGTSEKLGSCLPEPDPLVIPVPDPPESGVQIRHGLWPLPVQDENEICMAHYYDFSELVPEDARVECPERFQFRRRCTAPHSNHSCQVDEDCPEGAVCGGSVLNNLLNPESACFAIRRVEWAQDPQSHHGVILNYSGKHGLDDLGWGPWTYKFRDTENPLHGSRCDPTDIDPAAGMNPFCSAEPTESIGCVTYGPSDYGNAGSIFSAAGVANQFAITQEPYLDHDLPAGVYFTLPIKGITVWNSHAFNFTNGEAALGSYLNLEFARGEERKHTVFDLFDVSSIFAMSVPPFERQEICRTYTFPQNTHLFRMSSHTHKRGTLFRVWEPPNAPCKPQCPSPPGLCELPLAGYDYDVPVCDGPREDVPVYYSTNYADPVNLAFEPPWVFDGESVEDRTVLYCAVYENGFSEDGPEVKRQSTSPSPAEEGGLGAILGGPCANVRVACYNEGPNQGERCLGNDAFCDSFPGAGDGVCDACPATGGTTTEDEMFSLFGDFYVAEVPEPSGWLQCAAAVLALGVFRASRESRAHSRRAGAGRAGSTRRAACAGPRRCAR